MASKLESGFGARLRNAQDLVIVLTQFNLTPPRTEDTAVEINALCTTIAAKNDALNTSTVNYNTATKAREAAFNAKSETSVMGMLTYIRKYVDSMYGRDSLQSAQIATAIKDIRGTKTAKIKPTSTAASSAASISQSQQSYGSKISKFANVVGVIATFQGYNPDTPHLKLPALQTYVSNLTAFNSAVTQNIALMRSLQQERIALYDDLKNRCLRAKSHIVFKAGVTSTEYGMIKSMKF